MTTLKDLLSQDSPDLGAIERHLDGLSPEARLAECRALGKLEQRRLFHGAAGYRPLGLEDLVPKTAAPTQEIVHHGKNSLPMFSHFAKVFCRPEDAAPGEVWGYNRNSGFVGSVSGPGYFITEPHDQAGELLVNYLRVPPRRPIDTWPEVTPNEIGFSRFVFKGMQDILRGVSKHVTIGRAKRHGEETDNWFILCREDP